MAFIRNRSMKLFRPALLLLLFAGPAWPRRHARPPREIEQLITALGVSGCDFQRNGSWYTATKAEAHLRRKYDWLLRTRHGRQAEQFIERAASQSSMSGRAYQVRCPGKPVVTSSSWLARRDAAAKCAGMTCASAP